ncbi:MAG: hypothetical protein U9R34_00755 [Nanoarchaeota archaeon]|nr:hypothetical protein [Nanoarchaeota archaeon]
MDYSLIFLDQFVVIIGSALILSFVFLLGGLYYIVKLYYFLQMSGDINRASKIVLKIFFYGIFGPIIILFLANDIAIPLFARPTAEQLAAHQAGTLHLSLIEHSLNTGALYLVLVAIIALTWVAYYFYSKNLKKEREKKELEEDPYKEQYKEY